MLELIPAPDHVVAFRAAGTLTADDYARVIPQIDAKLEEFGNISIFMDISDLEDISADALKVDMKYGLSRLGDMNRFRRSAVVSDKQWVAAVVAMTAPLFPRIGMRVFGSDDRDGALAWASATD